MGRRQDGLYDSSDTDHLTLFIYKKRKEGLCGYPDSYGGSGVDRTYLF